jgi:predicted alpha/beta hydrolase family esterase
MKNTIIIHGAPEKSEYRDVNTPSPSNSIWIPWLQKHLALRDEISVALEMPRPYDGIYSEWVEVISSYKINSETVLIGHSCGAGFLLRYLSENQNLQPAKVIFIAPWLDPEPHELTTPFFDFKIDTTLAERTDLLIFMSSDDLEGCLKSFEIIKSELPNAHYYEFTDKDHFCTPELPELLELL